MSRDPTTPRTPQRTLVLAALILMGLAALGYALQWPEDLRSGLVTMSSADPGFSVSTSHGNRYSPESMAFRNAAGLACVFDGPSYEPIRVLVLAARSLEVQCFPHGGVLVVVGIVADGRAALAVQESERHYRLEAQRDRFLIGILLALAVVLVLVRVCLGWRAARQLR